MMNVRKVPPNPPIKFKNIANRGILKAKKHIIILIHALMELDAAS